MILSCVYILSMYMEVGKMIKDASISECSKYRYSLSRIWDNNKPKVLFVMLNPSTADADNDDPTIRRCINFAKDWGYGGLYVGNLYSYRATNPKELNNMSVLLGDDEVNRIHLMTMSIRCEKIICAWGNNAKFGTKSIDGLFRELYCLALSKEGNPKHPLYLKKDLKPILFKI
jgi:hypothetical protein